MAKLNSFYAPPLRNITTVTSGQIVVHKFTYSLVNTVNNEALYVLMNKLNCAILKMCL